MAFLEVLHSTEVRDMDEAFTGTVMCEGETKTTGSQREYSHANVLGTYIHGFFDSDELREAVR